MDKQWLDELKIYVIEISKIANGERFGANHSDYKPDINRFEHLVYRFYEIVSSQELPIRILQGVVDAQNSLNRQFMGLRNVNAINKFETMKNIFSEIDHIMNCLDELKKD